MPDVTVTPTLTISGTAPSSPAPGDLWWNSTIGVFFVCYDDGTSVQWVTTQPVKYINIAELQAPAGGDLAGYYPNPSIKDEVALEYPVLKNPLLLNDYTQRLASTKWVTDMFASFGLLGQVTGGPGILLTPDPMAGDSTIALRPIDPPVATGTYGGAAQTPVITVDTYGRITVVAGAAIPPINSPAFTGIPTAPTAGPTTDTDQIATTGFVQDVFIANVPGIYAPLASPVFIGDPRAPNPGPNDDDTSIATTAWVRDLITFTAARVVFAGADGYPTTDAGFTYNSTTDVLSLGGLLATRTGVQSEVGIAADAGFNAGISLYTGASLRWIFRKNSTAESGSDAGSDLELISRNDAGAALHTVLTAKRSTGFVGINTSAALTLARLHLRGVGSILSDMSTVADLGATIYVQDTTSATVGSGGMIMFGAGNGAFAAIKGYHTNASNNSQGHLVVGTRRATTDPTLTETLRFLAGGGITINATTALAAGGVLGNGINFSTTANFGINYGSGVPDKAMARGSIYLRSDGLPYFNNDGTAGGWAPLGGTVTVSDTAPVAPNDGQLWWNSVLGSLFIYYNDGNTTQWVPASAPMAGQALISANDTIVYMAANTTIGVGTVDLCNTGAIGAAGETWELEGNALIDNSGPNPTIAGVGIWNGSAYVAGGGGVMGWVTAAWGVTSTCKAKVTLTGPLTFTLRGTGNHATARARTSGEGGLANRATWISARRVS